MSDRRGLAGAGVYGLNEAGHARVAPFPDVISDDGFVHRSFADGERVVPAGATSVVRPTTELRREPAATGPRPPGNQQLAALGLPLAEGPLRLGALVDLLRTRRVGPVDAGCVPRAGRRGPRRGSGGAGSAGPRSPGAPTRRAGQRQRPGAADGRWTCRLITHRGFAARSDGRSGSAMEPGGCRTGTTTASALLLSAAARRHERDLSPADVRRLLLDDPSELAEVLPTFAAAVVTPSGGVRAWPPTTSASGTSSTRQRTVPRSCRPRATPARVELGSGLDLEAVAVQSSLGLAARPAHAVRRRPQARAGGHRDAGGRHARPDLSYPRRACLSGLDLDHAVRVAAERARTYLTAYLEDHPDAGLQLTGGQDSRLLLSAVPQARRRGLRVVTLGVAGDPDVDIAADLAARYGMRHEILSLSGLEDLDPAEA